MDCDDQKINRMNLSNISEFSHFFSTHYVQIYRYIYGLTGGSQEEAEDLTSETFSRAWSSRQSFNGNAKSALNWLFTIAKNQVVDRFRKEMSSEVPYSINDAPPLSLESTLESNTMFTDQREILWQLLQTLPEKTKEILVLRYFLEWKVIEIANYLDKKETTVSMTINRALKQLQNLWPKEDD